MYGSRGQATSRAELDFICLAKMCVKHGYWLTMAQWQAMSAFHKATAKVRFWRMRKKKKIELDQAIGQWLSWHTSTTHS